MLWRSLRNGHMSFNFWLICLPYDNDGVLSFHVFIVQWLNLSAMSTSLTNSDTYANGVDLDIDGSWLAVSSGSTLFAILFFFCCCFLLLFFCLSDIPFLKHVQFLSYKPNLLWDRQTDFLFRRKLLQFLVYQHAHMTISYGHNIYMADNK